MFSSQVYLYFQYTRYCTAIWWYSECFDLFNSPAIVYNICICLFKKLENDKSLQREHVIKKTFLAEASAKGGGSTPPPTVKKCKLFSQNNKNAWNVLKLLCKKYFVKFLQKHPLKWKYFSFRIEVFFVKIFHFKLFLSKTYIFIHLKIKLA